MKIPCRQHGAHFGDEQADIIDCPDVWALWGLTNLPDESKRDLVGWLVEMPSDKIFLQTGWGIGIAIGGTKVNQDTVLAESEAYQQMSEAARRNLQRDALKAQLKPKGLSWPRFRKK